MIAEAAPTERRQAADDGCPPGAVKCGLGRPLGNCSLRRHGCESLFDVLRTIYPPPALLAELRKRPQLDPDVARWLRRLEGVIGR